MVAIYFAFTTLSTVGFGDFHPKTDFERVFCVFMLIIGLNIFSVFVDSLLEQAQDLKTITFSDDSEEEHLLRFFGVLKKFNCNTSFNKQKMQ